MNKDYAVERLKLLIGKDLVKLAKENNITIFKDSKKNKGWAGQTIERYLGLQLNTSRAPNLGSWELKLVSCIEKDKFIKAKETIAVTMIDDNYVKSTSFEDSHLYTKINRFVLVGRLWASQKEEFSKVLFVKEFNINNYNCLFDEIKNDYIEIQNIIIKYGFDALSGKIGKWIQPRTKGSKNSNSRAFYIKKPLINLIIKDSYDGISSI